MANADAVRAAQRLATIERVERDPVARRNLDDFLRVFDDFRGDSVSETAQMQALRKLDAAAEAAREEVEAELADHARRALTRYIVDIAEDEVVSGYRWHVGSPAHIFIDDSDGLGQLRADRVIRALQGVDIAVTEDTGVAAAAVLSRRMAEGRENRTVSTERPLVLVTDELNDDARSVLVYGRTERVYVVFVESEALPDEVRAAAVDIEKLRFPSFGDDDGI